jgi:hypothetical protein
VCADGKELEACGTCLTSSKANERRCRRRAGGSSSSTLTTAEGPTLSTGSCVRPDVAATRASATAKRRRLPEKCRDFEIIVSKRSRSPSVAPKGKPTCFLTGGIQCEREWERRSNRGSGIS